MLVPDWIYYAISGVALVCILIVSTLSKQISVLYRVLTILFALIFAFGLFMVHGKVTDEQWQERIKKENEAIVILQAKQKEITTEVVVKYVDKIKYIEGKQRVITKEIPKYITKEVDANCSITNGFIWLHDQSAQNSLSDAPRYPNEVSPSVKLSTVTTTVTENYETYHKVAEQLRMLQEWINKQKDLNNG
jgi:Ca2+/Na+ antiporter